MGAFSGALTYRQYSVGALPANWQDRVTKGLIAHRAERLKEESEELRAVGWCNAQYALDNELSVDRCLLNEYLVVGMRVETIKLPVSLVKLYCESEERKAKKELKKDVLSRYERADIKEQIEKQLRRKILPSFKLIEMIWNVERGLVRFFNTSKGFNEEFMELFEESFGVQLTPDYAFTLAQATEMGLSRNELKVLKSVESTPYVDQETLIEMMKGAYV